MYQVIDFCIQHPSYCPQAGSWAKQPHTSIYTVHWTPYFPDQAEIPGVMLLGYLLVKEKELDICDAFQFRCYLPAIIYRKKHVCMCRHLFCIQWTILDNTTKQLILISREKCYSFPVVVWATYLWNHPLPSHDWEDWQLYYLNGPNVWIALWVTQLVLNTCLHEQGIMEAINFHTIMLALLSVVSLEFVSLVQLLIVLPPWTTQNSGFFQSPQWAISYPLSGRPEVSVNKEWVVCSIVLSDRVKDRQTTDG